MFDKKPAAIVTASPGSIGGFGANHQIRQAAVFLNMPVMQQPEAYLGHVTDDSFDADGCLKEGPLKELVTTLAHAFAGWVETIHPVAEAARGRCGARQGAKKSVLSPERANHLDGTKKRAARGSRPFIASLSVFTRLAREPARGGDALRSRRCRSPEHHRPCAGSGTRS